MNKEEKKAIEYYQGKEISFSVDFDTEKLLKALGITEEDSFENHQIRFKTLLNLIEKLQKENEELKNLIAHKNEYTKKLEEDLFENCNNYVIPTQKVKDKIEELKQERTLKCDNYMGYKIESREQQDIDKKIIVLQELLIESEE